MNFTSITAFRTGLLLAAIALQAAQAQTPPAKDRIVTRDELRVCMNSEGDLAARRQAMEARKGQDGEEVAAIRAEAQELTAERERLQRDDKPMERFERKVKAHNARVKAAQDKAEAFRADLESLNKALVAHNDNCGGIAYKAEDKAAILQERAAKKAN